MAGNYSDILLYDNPTNPKRKRKRRRRNQMAITGVRLPKGLRQFANVSLGEVTAATGGLAAATMIPAATVKDRSTNLRKLGALAVGLLAATGAGMIAGALNRGLARAAVLGGAAGVGATALGMFSQVQIGGGQRQLHTGSRTLNLGESREVSPDDDAGIQVSVT